MIERRRRISEEEFSARYKHAGRPVIITNLTDRWAAMSKWTPAYFKYACGDERVQVLSGRQTNANYETSYDLHRKDMKFGDYVDWVVKVKLSNARYIHAQNLLLQTEAGRRLVSDIEPTPNVLIDEREGRTFFWFGPAGTLTPLHQDSCDIMFCQVRGRKRFRLISPNQSHLVYSHIPHFSPMDCEDVDLERFPLARYIDMEIVDLRRGEALFLPVGWWHHVRALDMSIGVSFTGFK